MVVFDGREDDGRRAGLAVEVKCVAAFIHAPTVILAAPHQMSGFPKILTIVAGPDSPGLLINGQSPGIAQTIGPIFRSCVFYSDEWVVLGHGVRLRSVRTIYVDAQNAAVQIAQVLTRHPVIRIARAVATGNVEHPVMPKHQATTVMTHRTPLDNHLL